MAIKLDEARVRLLNIVGGITPTANNSLNLGTSSYKWANVYATTFTGNLSGNATTATNFSSAKTITLTGDVTGSASSTGASAWSIAATVVDDSHNHSYLSKWPDTRNTTTVPNDYNGQLKVVGIKTATGSGTLDGSSYSTLVGIRGWSDSSGGNSHELAFTGSGALYRRHGSTTSWNAWVKVLDSGNYSSYALPLSGGTLSGALTVNSTITATGNIKGAYIQGTWLYTSAATAQTTTSKIAVIHSDNYIYYITPANLTTLIKNNASGSWAISVTGSSGSCTGNAATATAWASAQTLTLAGDLSGSVSIKGNAAMTLTATVKDDSHNHVISNVDNLQTALDNKAGGSNYFDIVVGGDANTYYPVVLSSVASYYPLQLVNISRTYSEAAPDTWNNATHRGGLTMTLLWNGSRYWDGNSSGNACYCVYLYESYSTMVGGLGNSTSGIVVWLRGGTANYHIHSLNGKAMTATVYLSTFTDSAKQEFAPKTTPSAVSIRWPGYAQGADTASAADRLANSRSLKISGTPGTTGTNFNGSADATLIIPATVKTFTELGTNKISSSSALYISPASTLYVDSAAGSSLIFRPQGTERARFNTSGDFTIKTILRPDATNTYSLGSTTYKWKTIYATTAYTDTTYAGTAATKGNIYLQASGDSSTMATYARFYVNAAGTVGDGTTAVNGSVYLTLGNSTASSTTTTAGLNNAYGIVRIYGTGTTYQQLRAINGSTSRTTYLRDHGATAYLVATTTTGAVGSSTGPVYINSSGVATACGTSLAVSITGNAATASSVAWANVTGKPSSFTPSSHTHSYLPLTGGQLTGNLTIKKASWGTFAFKNESDENLAQIAISNSTNAFDGLLTFRCYSSASAFSAATLSNAGVFTASQVKGAVWNDYAEYRESDCQEFGRVLAEKGDDTLTKTTKRLQAFAGISSDTWGYSQGETEKAKTPIAVAGRVLAYTYRNRNAYKPGDCVCAAPNGTVDIMTREEIIKYPDRIVGTVSCVPEYETWGSGDRDPVKINNRIWIKVR